MQYLPYPLFLPASKIKFKADCFFEIKKDHLICVATDQRVLYWTSKKRGAREIIENLEYGQVCFGTPGDVTLYLLVYTGGQKDMRLYEVNLETNTVAMTKLPETISGLVKMVYSDGYFYIKADNGLLALEAATGKVQPGNDRIDVFDLMFENSKNAFANVSLSFYKRFVNNGYNTVNKVRRVFVNANGELGFDDRLISLYRKSQTILIRQEKNINQVDRIFYATEMEAPVMGLTNKYIKFSRFVWADGSEVLADSRGLLHLKSGDNSIPEITIVMIMNNPTACWAADGQVCGSVYFTGEATAQSQDVIGFYNDYIQRFIDRIKAHATNAKI